MAIPNPIHDDTPGSDVSDVARREFNIARKGYERDEVRWYLRRLAERIASLESELKSERTRARHAPRSPTLVAVPVPDLTPPGPPAASGNGPIADRLSTAIRSVDEAADRTRIAAEVEAHRLVESARAEAEAIMAEARAEADRRLVRATGPFDAVLAPTPEPVFLFESLAEPDRSALPGEPLPPEDIFAKPEPSPEQAAEPQPQPEPEQEQAPAKPLWPPFEAKPEPEGSHDDVQVRLDMLAKAIWDLDGDTSTNGSTVSSAPAPERFAYRPADHKSDIEVSFGERFEPGGDLFGDL